MIAIFGRSPALDVHASDGGLFAEPGLQREMTREERVMAKDMSGTAVPREEVLVELIGRGRRRFIRRG
ncbi:hypothetical protein KIH27_15835 [Mycobacterium sp. M1]|uniref:Uncharacterized protein n=1 Tax=Mycolicibacter acidiphilus TaxID=2835306 RepID=A0ABS5RL97_9MYCO|nr:hypothetical protein [Mycolicibacter acidiphilus]